MLALDLHQLEEVRGCDRVQLAPGLAGINEGTQAHLGEAAGTAGGDVAACVSVRPTLVFSLRTACDNERGQCFTKGHSLSARGRNASSAGIVATTFIRSHSPFDSAGVFACNRYMSRMTRPSSRMRPSFVMKSLIGIFRISAITA